MTTPVNRQTVEEWTRDVDFETLGGLRRLSKAVLFNPLANYLPASMMRGLLRFGKSELAHANWTDPGGWRSMVISYEGRPTQVADKVLVKFGSVPTALRNRRRLGARLLARLIDRVEHEPVQALCLGAGPGHIITDAMNQTSKKVLATLVDINSDAFEYGRQIAAEKGVTEQVRFIQGDVRDVREMLDPPPDVIKMLGICEYIPDEQLVDIIQAVAEVAPPGAAVVFNSISKAHGTDRFFRRVFGLHMIHRSPEELQALFSEGGFGDYLAVPEPYGVYHLIVGWRRADAAEGS